jgi:hypothetical protein
MRRLTPVVEGTRQRPGTGALPCPAARSATAQWQVPEPLSVKVLFSGLYV